MGLAISSIIEVVEGDDSSTDVLFSTLYCELHRMAKRELARQWLPANHAPSRNAIKRGGEFQLAALETVAGQVLSHPLELSATSDSLDQLAKAEPDLAEVVDLKFLCGFSFCRHRRPAKPFGTDHTEKMEKARLYLRCSLQAELSL